MSKPNTAVGMSWGDKGCIKDISKCNHEPDDGCEWCCMKCNTDTHHCPRCGTVSDHKETVCEPLCPAYMNNEPAIGVPKNWKYGYLPCGCSNDGYGNHRR